MEPKVILLAEDDPDDSFIFETKFRRAKLPHALHVAADGQQVLDWLRGDGEYANRERYPVPDILLLDLKMPLKSGFDVLEWLRGKEACKDLPVVVLSSSDDARDVERAAALGVNSFFVKSVSLQDIIEYLRSV